MWRKFSIAICVGRAYTDGTSACPLTLNVSLGIDGGLDAPLEEAAMEWTKPEFTVVAVTMEVTAYAATK